jgi:hypothetical protein
LKKKKKNTDTYLYVYINEQECNGSWKGVEQKVTGTRERPRQKERRENKIQNNP